MSVFPFDPTAPITAPWQGTLDLTYARRGTATQLVHTLVRAPLKVQRPFYPEGESVCHSVILHTAGGVVGGDRLCLTVQLQPEAHALMTTAAAAKIYRSNGQEAQQQVQIRVEAGACLEWLPLETIVFEQALYRQQLRIDLAPRAVWLGWDICRFGRTARGEKFLAGDWRSRTEVWQGEQPLWIDRQWLPGSPDLFNSPHALAGCPVVGSLALVGREIETAVVEQIRHCGQPETGQVGVTRLPAGIVCRYRGHSTTAARRWFLAVWQQLRPRYAGRSLCIPRVWGRDVELQPVPPAASGGE